MGKFIDLTGQRFGMLEAVSRAPNYEKYSKTHGRVLKYAKWNCLCDCGNTCEILATDLKSESQVSCGCHKVQLGKEKFKTHGLSEEPEYIVWLGMKSRCNDVGNSSFERYGALGVKVEEPWNSSFESFYIDMGPRPDGTTLDRIDSNGNYCKENCRWATLREQSLNKRKYKNTTSKFKFVHKRGNSWVGGFRDISGKDRQIIQSMDELKVAKETYQEFKKEYGFWPPYCEDHLEELGLDG